jgi:hypothetical protein
MLSRIRPRLTFANVISVIALFAALSGGAYATIDRKIGTKDLNKGAVSTKKLKKQAVGTGKIKPQAVKAGQLADGAVTTPKIFDEAVVADKIGAQAVTGPKIADNAVGTLKLANGAVGTEQLANEAVETGKLAPQAVQHGKLADGAVIPSKLGNIVTRTNQVAIPVGEQRTLGVACLPNELVLSGGAGFTTESNTNVSVDRFLIRSRKAGNGWSARAGNESTAARTLRVEAYCLQP